MKQVKLLMVALMLSLSCAANAQTGKGLIKALEKVLDAYCIEYYNTDFSGRSYVGGSISIYIPSNPEDVINPLTGGLDLEGTHSYRGKFRNAHSGVKWRASVKPLGNNKYKIKFDKWYEPDLFSSGHWENGATREYEYKE